MEILGMRTQAWLWTPRRGAGARASRNPPNQPTREIAQPTATGQNPRVLRRPAESSGRIQALARHLLRVSTHFYNDASDVERLREAL